MPECRKSTRQEEEFCPHREYVCLLHLYRHIHRSDEEKEYHDEYRLCIEDGGCISEGERRLLDKLSTRLGISRERALEIEKMI